MYSLLFGTFLVDSVQVLDDIVLLRCKLDGGAGFEQGALGQLSIGSHLLQLKKDFLVLAHIGEHQVHAAN